MWDNVDLEGVGIPSQSRGTGSKIVLTTRSFNVCNKMETDEEIKVDVLLKKEAWELFREVVSQVVDAPEIQGIAKQIVEKCRGLPLTIKVIGGFLRKKKDVHVWKNALYEMSSAKYEIIDDKEDSVFKILKFSYDQLKTKRKKNCFLYCALFPEDSMIKIEELIYYWVGEGFISDGVVQSLDDAINRGYTIVDELCNASLLEFTKDRHGDKCVKVHDVIRDLALRITSPATSTLDNFPSDEGESGIFLVRARVEMEDPPCVEEWKQKHRISLMENGNLYYLPDRPQCDSLLTLLLQKNSKLERIPESFFEHMHNLRVLDISKTGIDDLPPSISCLVNLRGLYAMYTGLRKCPSQIGCLRSLEVLHLGGGEMEYLPTEVGQLTRLRSLIVIFSRYGGSVVVEGKRMIPRGMLSRLSLLEDLRVDNVGPGLDEDWVEIGESIAEEVDSLNKLTRLEMNFPKLDSYLKFVQESFAVKTQRLKTSHLSIGYHVKDQMSFSPLVDVGEHRLRFLDSIELLPNDDIRVTVSRATKLFLEGCTTPRKLSDLGMENFKGIKEIYIKGCERVESVIDGNDLNDSFMATHCQVLPNLQTLDLSNLDNLRSIWEGAAPPQSLNQLTSIHVYCCDNLPFIFSRCMILHLPNLQTLHVSNCLRVEEIVKEEEEEGEEKNEMVGSSSNQVDDHHDFVHLPCLSKLSLVCLPKLRRVCKRVRLALPPSVQIFISSCPEVIKQGFEWWEDDGSNSSNILHMEWDSTVVTGWREKIVKRKKMI
uniref:NB-ARC domain-containing protein n=2 Tax=Nelumbo nucifera TaxID=4432 RepID=A0A822Y540_NELNU|nr:TPA_asm: hypothetical protein HUJ06_029128 [Nelumbo nucifera]